jgi:hypothetical protein
MKMPETLTIPITERNQFDGIDPPLLPGDVAHVMLSSDDGNFRATLAVSSSVLVRMRTERRSNRTTGGAAFKVQRAWVNVWGERRKPQQRDTGERSESDDCSVRRFNSPYVDTWAPHAAHVTG